MSATQRANRLRMEIREAIHQNILALRRQSKKEGVTEEDTDHIDRKINDLLDQLDELSQISLYELENSEEVKKTVYELTRLSDDLEDEANEIKNLDDALGKGAGIVQKVTKIIQTLTGLPKYELRSAS